MRSLPLRCAVLKWMSGTVAWDRKCAQGWSRGAVGGLRIDKMAAWRMTTRAAAIAAVVVACACYTAGAVRTAGVVRDDRSSQPGAIDGSPSWNYCGGQEYPIKIVDFDVDPYPVVKGHDVQGFLTLQSGAQNWASEPTQCARPNAATESDPERHRARIAPTRRSGRSQPLPSARPPPRSK